MSKFRLAPAGPKKEKYDVVVVGAGPAGLSAALYSARFSLQTLIIAEVLGGTLTDAGIIDDYMGLPNIKGPDLARKFEEHVRSYGVDILLDKVVDIRREGEVFKIKCVSGSEYEGRAVILAVGSVRRKLNVPGETEFAGRGVSYCAVCDAPLYRGRVVAVVGGGNSALQSALLIASYASKVYLIHRRDSFRAFPIYVKLVQENPKIEVVLNSVVTEIGGTKTVEWVKIKNVKTAEERKLEVSGVFVEIGSEPPKDFFTRIGLEVDEKGYVVVKPGQITNIPGLFAAGDCTGGKFKKKFDQIITAAAEGAIAALSAYEYLMKGKEEIERPTY
ncbi:MAG: thioredoxin-disulfide reductase [Thermoprotei archaeon]|nr:MAG: thioredoxin-disulfide reductase [Thermoprotei archaeon]